MITREQYFGKWVNTADATLEIKENAEILLEQVNQLMAIAESEGIEFKINPSTGSQISGQTFGGFRPMSCKIGAIWSAHKQGMAVDIYDPENAIDDWCMANLDKLEKYGIYMEHPSATERWAHWGIKAPKSGNRVFYP
jgi:hypothetical protein